MSDPTFCSTLRQKRPGVVRKWFTSEALGKRFNLYVTNKAKRTIEKNGGLDQYLLNTKDEKICSVFGKEMKQAVKQKLKDPSARIPYIPTTAKVKLSRTKKELKRTYDLMAKKR